MKKLVPGLVGAFCMSVLGHLAQAQTTPAGGVGIGTATPDASALLDLTSGSKGLLAPRLTASQRGNIASPATGLLVYQTDGLQPGFWYYAATGWTFLNPSPTGAGDNLGNHTATQPLQLDTQPIYLNGAGDPNHQLRYQSGFFGPDGPQLFGYGGGELGIYQGGYTPVLRWNSNGQVGIGTTEPSQALDVNGKLRVRGLTAGFVTADADGNLSTTTAAAGDNLGNHIATQPLKLNTQPVYLNGTTDQNHQLRYNLGVDGPQLFGYDGGELGYRLVNQDAVPVLRWRNAGNVGIGTSNPDASALLDLTSNSKGLLAPRLTASQRGAITKPATGLLVYQTDGTQPGFWYYAATGWTFLNPAGGGGAGDNLGNHSATQNVVLNQNAIYLTDAGGSTHQLRYGSGPDGPQLFGTNGGELGYSRGTYTPVLRWTSDGRVGIGNNNPQATLDVPKGAVRLPGGGSAADTWFNYFGDGQNYLRGTTVLADQGGKVGIGTAAPTAQLDVAGDVRLRGLAAGFVTTDASGKLSSSPTAPGDNLGNHSATQNVVLNQNAIYLTDNGGVYHQLRYGSSPDGPQLFGYGGGELGYNRGTYAPVLRWTSDGRVGIGTSSPAVPLDVQSTTTPSAYSYSFFSNSGQNGQLGYANSTGAVSIRAAGRVVASEFDATSDARLKTITGRTDNAADLGLVRRLRITDYQMRDRAQYGARQFKKVIAQEVEQVFPQAVGRHAGFLPDVYALASAVTALPGDSLLRLTLPQALPTAAHPGQRVKLLGEHSELLGTVALAASGRTLVVRGAQALAGQRVFVFGLEHADVRTVDYEALAMLNVSATQELARQLEALQQQNAALRQQTQAQATRLDQQQASLQTQAAATASLAQRLQALETQLAPQARLTAEY